MQGFSLIEMLIAAVALAVLAAIAIPSYSNFMERARRSEAREALSDAAARQEQFFMDNKAYANGLAVINVNATTENGYYSITMPASTALSYTLRATAAGGQAGDTDCATMDLTNLRVKSPAGCW